MFINIILYVCYHHNVLAQHTGLRINMLTLTNFGIQYKITKNDFFKIISALFKEKLEISSYITNHNFSTITTTFEIIRKDSVKS